MDSLTLLSKPTTANSFSAIHFISHPNFIHSYKSKFLFFTKRKPRKILVYASSKDDSSKLDEWDQMEIKFGRMIGEDPKITIAKIMGRKSNPDISYLEIEKLLEKRKGKGLDEEIEEIPFNVSEEKKPITSVEGLNLVRPKLKKGLKFESTNKPREEDYKPFNRPIMNAKKETTSSVPNVILRKPSSFNEDDGGNEKSSRFGMRPNLSLNMGKEPRKERFSDMTLLRKPEQLTISPDVSEENSLKYEPESSRQTDDATLLQRPELRKPEPLTISPDVSEENSLKYEPESSRTTDDATLLQRPELRKPDLSKEGEHESLEEYSLNSGLGTGSAIELQEDILSDENRLASDEPFKTVLIEKPKRLDLSSKPMDQKIKVEASSMNRESIENQLELENFLSTSPIKECEEDDWTRAERLVKTGEREEVELISSSTKGFVASFGSLIGFLPYRNLAARWKFLAFESWLRRKGLDPSIYRQKLGIIGKYEANSMKESSELGVISEIDGKPQGEITSETKLEDLLMIYDQEKLNFLSSFIGQRIKVGVVLADRNSRRMIFSIKPKEKEELVEKKRSLMAKLSVGDVVKCCIKKITYFGVFVEVEGVPALIHQTEVSWDATLDPDSYFKVGQIVEAKVHQLDFSLERIFLSLKEITPDPLNEALEAVVGDNNSFDGVLEAAPLDTEWDDVESLIKELEQFDGIQSVSRGRYFLSPGLAPTFQVYMASMFENQYKLLARSENRVQEVIVKTSLGKDELKSVIMTCTNRVE